jgi:predicted DNA-binding transcriptional regulator YafY
MSRADRLMTLVDLLRARETTTIDALADELSVTRRTVLRDLATLRDRGLPITGEPGRGGGLRLERDRGVASLHLSISEVAALWLAARLSQEASDLPWAEAARSGLAKLLGCLPLDRARELRALCRRVIVGPPASNHVRGTAGPAPRELLRVFDEAFAARHGLAFRYVDREGRRSRRRVEPHGLLVEPPVWYVLARDLATGQPRTFRMDRISRPHVLREHTFREDAAVIRAQVQDHPRWRPLDGVSNSTPVARRER